MLRTALLACLLSAASASTIYGKKELVECDVKGQQCKINLGAKTGKIQLPALVAFKTAHGSYISVSPPNGGEPSLSGHPKAWEEWTMEKVGDKVAFKSHHNTYLSCRFHPADGFGMASERLGHELFTIVDKPDGSVHIMAHNGMWISASSDASLGIKQEMQSSAWETWTVEHTKDGFIALRSIHGTYLGASSPNSLGTVSHQPTMNTWETFVIDHVDKAKLTIETSHDTYLAAHADPWNEDKVITMERASLWELWTPFVNQTASAICLQSNDGRFLQAAEGEAHMSLTEHCMEHEQFQIVMVNEKMLAQASKEAADKRKAAETEAAKNTVK